MLPKSSACLMESESVRTGEIQTAAGVSEKVFVRFYLPILLAYMDQVQQMPLSDNAFSKPGGAINFGMQAALISLRVASSQMFYPELKAEERRVLEPQCRFAAFTATLASGVVMLSQNAFIATRDGSFEYHPLVSSMPLVQWLEKNPEAIFTWRKNEPEFTQCESSAIAARFIPNGLLNDFDLRISLMLFNAINPQQPNNGIESTLAKVVRQVISKVIYYDIDLEKKKYLETSTSVGDDLRATDRIYQTFFEKRDMATEENLPDVEQDAKHMNLPAPKVTVLEVPHPRKNSDCIDVDNVLLASAHPTLREWFQTLPRYNNFAKLQDLLEISDKGISVPLAILGSFGIAGTTVRKMMNDAALIVERTDNGRGIWLDIRLKPLLMAAY